MVLALAGGGGWWVWKDQAPAESGHGPVEAAPEAVAAVPVEAATEAPAETTPAEEPITVAAADVPGEGSFTLELPDSLPDTPPITQAWALGMSSAATVVSRPDEAEPELFEDDAEEASAAKAPQPEVVFPQVIELSSLAANSPTQSKAREEALQLAFKERAWEGYAAMLTRSLVAATRRLSTPPRPEEISALLNQPLFRETLARRALLETLPKKADHQFLSDDDHRMFVEALFTRPEMAEAFLVSLVPENQPGRVLAQWAELWEGDRGGRERFRELALACALVFEKPVTLTWNDERLRLTADARYTWYQQQAAAGRLVGKIDRMPARDLVWVVSAPVPESELEWALKKVSLRQKGWGAAYTMVEYDMERAVKGTNNYDAYTFAEILKKGGICGDRAYFASNTARANGIPAAYVSGDGARGPHAWFRWMDADGTWHEAGRFAGYALGNTTHPQTGRGLSEEIFEWRSEGRTADDGPLRAAGQRVWLAEVLEEGGDVPRASGLYDLAARSNRHYPVAAAARLDFWLRHRTEAPLDEWKELVRLVKKDFRVDPSVMALVRQAEEGVIFPRQDGKTVMLDLRRDARKLDKEARRRGTAPRDEEIALSFARQAEILKKAGNYEGIHSLYRRALDDRSNTATFKRLARDFCQFTADSPEAVARACRQLESSWKRHVDTGGDYFDIDSQNQALAVVIECYKKAGNEPKAKSLQRDLDRRQGKAERKAL